MTQHNGLTLISHQNVLVTIVLISDFQKCHQNLVEIIELAIERSLTINGHKIRSMYAQTRFACMY